MQKNRFISLLTSMALIGNYLMCISADAIDTNLNIGTSNSNDNILYGDVNKDGAISPFDAMLTLKGYTGEVTLTNEQMVIADVNDDGSASPFDAMLILKGYTGEVDINSWAVNQNKNDDNNVITEDEVYQTGDETVNISDTVGNASSLKEINASWYSNADETIKTQDVKFDSDGNWSIENLPLDVGTNYVTVTLTYTDDTQIVKEYTLQRISTEIQLADEVKLYNDDTVQNIYDTIIDNWTNDMATEDTKDDEVCILVTQDNPILQSINNGEIVQNDIIYIPSCELFPNGLSLLYMSHDTSYDTNKYQSDTYVVIHTKYASIGDILDDEDVFISYDSIDANNISWIPYQYDDDAINQYYNSTIDTSNQSVSNFLNVQCSNDSFQYLSSEPINLDKNDTKKADNSNLKKNWNFENFIKNTHVNVSSEGTNLSETLSSLEICVSNEDAVIFDADGDEETENDQLKGSISFTLSDINPTVALETHNTLGVTTLDQFICKLDYTKSLDVEFGGEASLSFDELFLNDEEEDDDSNIISLAKVNKEKDFGISGVDLSDKFILGSIGIDLTGHVQSELMTSSDDIVSIVPKVFIMVYLDLEGNISVSYSLSYSYSSAETFGFNLQNKKYVGANGSYEDNKSSNENNNYEAVGYGLTFYDGSNSKTLANEFSGEISAELHTSVGLNAGIGISTLNIVPVFGHIGAKIGTDIKGSCSLTYNALEENNWQAEATGNLNVYANLNGGVDCRLSLDKFNIEFNHTIPLLDYNLFDIGIIPYRGRVVSSKDNECIPNATIVITPIGDLPTTIITDDNGEFSKILLYANAFGDRPYNVNVSANNFDTFNDNEYIINKDGDYSDVEFILNPTEKSISGSICDENTNPINGVDVTVSTIDNQVLASATTDDDGKFSISLDKYSEDDKYIVTFSKDGFETTTKEVTIDGVISIGNVTLVSTEPIIDDDPTKYGEIVDSGTCGDSVNWNLYEDGTMVISGTGNMKNSIPWEDYTLSIKKLIVKYGITSIAGFSGCSALSSVSIADSVEYIDSSAFKGCISLAEINIPSSVTEIGKNAFEGCKSLCSVNLNSGLVNIGSYAFYKCISLENITIPSTVNVIYSYAFRSCTSLKSIVLPNSLTTIYDYSFSDCTALESVTINSGNIGHDAFSGCTSLKNLILNEGVNSIGRGAFSYCDVLEDVIIPSTVSSIDNGSLLNAGSFQGCKNLHNVTICDGVSYIGSYAFNNCISLESINIPNSVKSIGSNAFSKCELLSKVSLGSGLDCIKDSQFANCTSLREINIPRNITTIDDSAFYGCKSLVNVTLNDGLIDINSDAFRDCTSLENINIPNTVVSMGNGVFDGCSSLKNIDIPSSVVSMGYDMFSNCTSLTSIIIPDTIVELNCGGMFYNCTSLTDVVLPNNAITSIRGGGIFSDGTFENCSSLKTVRIPNGVTDIEKYAFGGCTALESINIPSSVTSISDYAFYTCDALTTIYGESGSYAETWANEKGYTFVAI